jgi:hypothetical protein
MRNGVMKEVAALVKNIFTYIRSVNNIFLDASIAERI